MRRSAAGSVGFTLVELVMAMAITVVVLMMTMSAFINAQQASEVGANIMETNQNVRAGMTYMNQDLMQTGNGIPTGGIPIPFGTNSVPVLRPGPTAGMQFPAWQVLHALTPGDRLGPVIDGQETDVLTVIFADRSIPIESYPLVTVTQGGTRATVDNRTPINSGPNRIQAGDLILFSNALGYAIQTVTGTNGGQQMYFDAGDPFRFNQLNTELGGMSAIDNANGTFPPTTATRITMVTYYVDSVTNPLVPRLVRRRNFDAPRPVALVVDNLQFTFDFVDGSNVINPALVNIAQPVAPITPAQARKVNVYLSARSESLDTRTRQTFRTNLASQLSLRSMAFVDRYR